MKCQKLFSGRKEETSILSSAGSALSVVKVKLHCFLQMQFTVAQCVRRVFKDL